MLQCPINHSLASVDLSNHDMDRGFLGDLVLKVKKNLKRVVMSVESHEDIGFLELVEGVLLVDLLGTLKPDKGLLRLGAVVADHAHVSVKHR
jgi:hypothetical protein